MAQDYIPESERCEVTVLPKGERALARFYPPDEGGALLTEENIISDLRMAGIKHGVKRKAIEHFLAHREYNRDYIIAECTPPIQGHDAVVTYLFDVNVTAKPKLNEDGSVDFHQLGNIKTVNKGDKLAVLTPMDKGRPGISVLGTPLKPVKVKNRHLRYGRNITISEDRCELYSKVSGHVTLVDDMVMVSDIYHVPANVDASTGDIQYKGTVEVTGNVNTGFKIEAGGDIIVHGVTEGATLISSGNIVLKRGMQGMDRGLLQAEGNVTAKFLENCEVNCKGGVKADAILHSKIECRDNVSVRGRKGLINGGYIHTYGTIHATTLGSTMGASTKIVVISDMELQKRVVELRDKISETEEALEKIDQVAANIKQALEAGKEPTESQINYVKQAVASKPALSRSLREMRIEREDLQTRIDKHKNACVMVEDVVYSGVRLTIKDAMKNVHDNISRCKFVREGADVRMKSF
ncbi:MAG: FapA family protein [Eubacterium sp.]|nr:FapA family protein [Eubacterium sp.]